VLTALASGADTNLKSHFNLLPPNEPFSRFLPRSIADKELDAGLEISMEIQARTEDELDYVAGFNAYVQVFFTWSLTRENRKHKPRHEILDQALNHVQGVLDDLPPALRWRGGLSRDPRTTPGHEIQMVNILISSLYIKSNLLQHFASSTLPHLTHQTITRQVNTYTRSHPICLGSVFLHNISRITQLS
jgi:hypothetical protein